MKLDEIGQYIKQKSPGVYDEYDDADVATVVLKHYPEYSDLLDDQPIVQEPSIQEDPVAEPAQRGTMIYNPQGRFVKPPALKDTSSILSPQPKPQGYQEGMPLAAQGTMPPQLAEAPAAQQPKPEPVMAPRPENVPETLQLPSQQPKEQPPTSQVPTLENKYTVVPPPAVQGPTPVPPQGEIQRNRTKLEPQDEQFFQQWFKDVAGITGISPNPDDPEHKYDYRGAFKAGHSPILDEENPDFGHWPSQFKDDDHPNRFVNGVDTKYGQGVPQPKEQWQADIEAGMKAAAASIDTEGAFGLGRKAAAATGPILSAAPGVIKEGVPLMPEAAILGAKRLPYRTGQMAADAVSALEDKEFQQPEPQMEPNAAMGAVFAGIRSPYVAKAAKLLSEADQELLQGKYKIPEHIKKNLLARGTAQGVEMLGPTMSTVATSIVTGSPLAAVPTTMALFGLSTYKNTKDELINAGIPEKEADTKALIHGISEGGIETIGNVVELATMGLGKPAKEAAKELAKRGVKGLVKRLGSVFGEEYAEEVAQGSTEKYLKDKYKDNPKVQKLSWSDVLVEPVIPVLISTLGLGGMAELARRGAIKGEEPSPIKPEIVPETPSVARPEVTTENLATSGRLPGEVSPEAVQEATVREITPNAEPIPTAKEAQVRTAIGVFQQLTDDLESQKATPEQITDSLLKVAPEIQKANELDDDELQVILKHFIPGGLEGAGQIYRNEGSVLPGDEEKQVDLRPDEEGKDQGGKDIRRDIQEPVGGSKGVAEGPEEIRQQGRQIATQLNEQFPGHDIRFDGIQVGTNGNPTLQFTTKKQVGGMKAGVTFNAAEPTLDSASEKLKEMREKWGAEKTTEQGIIKDTNKLDTNKWNIPEFGDEQISSKLDFLGKHRLKNKGDAQKIIFLEDRIKSYEPPKMGKFLLQENIDEISKAIMAMKEGKILSSKELNNIILKNLPLPEIELKPSLEPEENIEDNVNHYLSEYMRGEIEPDSITGAPPGSRPFKDSPELYNILISKFQEDPTKILRLALNDIKRINSQINIYDKFLASDEYKYIEEQLKKEYEKKELKSRVKIVNQPTPDAEGAKIPEKALITDVSRGTYQPITEGLKPEEIKGKQPAGQPTIPEGTPGIEPTAKPGETLQPATPEMGAGKRKGRRPAAKGVVRPAKETGINAATTGEQVPERNAEGAEGDVAAGGTTAGTGGVTTLAMGETEGKGGEPVLKWGEHIGGSKYDRAKARITISDLADMTDREKEKYVVKDNVWPKPDYSSMVDSGTPKHVAFIIKQIKDSLPPKPNAKENQELYINELSRIKDIVENIKTEEGVKNLFNKIFPAEYYDNDQTYGKKWTAKGRQVASMLGNKFVKHVQVGSYNIRQAISKVEETGFPEKQESWKRGIEIRQDQREKDWFITQGHRIIADKFKTQEEAEKHLTEVLKPKLEESLKRGKQLKRPELSHIERTGTDYRKGKDVTPDDLISTFGFRGVEAGKWNIKDIQEYVNHAYDALMDLSKILDLPPKALSLNGELGFAFGARGGGWASAHYEPSKVVINLTKTRGAGATAHEWAHALDDYFGRISGDKKLGTYTSHGVSTASKIRPEMIKAWESISRTINNRLETPEEATARINKSIETIKKNIRGWLHAIESEMKYSKIEPSETWKNLSNVIIDGATGLTVSDQLNQLRSVYNKLTGKSIRSNEINGLHGNLSALQRENENLAQAQSGKPYLKNIKTSYVTDAAKIGGDYWTRHHELFARAFESFIDDKITEGGEKSQYLAHSTKNELWGHPGVFPEGSEREVINKEFQNFFKTIQTKETDKGIALYSISPQKPPLPPSTQQIVTTVTPLSAKTGINLDVSEKVSKDYPANARAAYHPDTDSIELIAENIESPEEAARIFIEESVGHRGLRKTMGKDVDSFLMNLWLAKNKDIKASGIPERYEHDLGTKEGKLGAAEEWFAHEAVNNPEFKKTTWWTRFVAMVRDWLRKIGLKLKLSDNDIASVLNRAAEIKAEQKAVSEVPAVRGYEPTAPVTTYDVKAKAVLFEGQPLFSLKDMQQATLDEELRDIDDRIRKARGIGKTEKSLQRVKQTLTDLKNAATRHFTELDPKKHGQLIDLLRLFENTSAYSKTVAWHRIYKNIRNLNPEQFDTFTMSIVLPDVLDDFNRVEPGEEAVGIHWGYKDSEQVQKHIDHYNSKAEADPKIKKALEERKTFMDNARTQLVDKGLLNQQALNNENYFHRQTLEYMDLKEFKGTGTSSQDVRTHKKGWQRARVENIKDYNTDYLESEYEVLSQSLSQIAAKDILDRIEKQYNLKKSLVKQAAKENLENYNQKWIEEGNDPEDESLKKLGKRAMREYLGKDYVEWDQLIPDTHTTWKPKPGQAYYWASTIPDKVIEQLIAREKNIEDEDVRKVLARGRDAEWILPKEVAKTMDSLNVRNDEGIVNSLTREMLTLWKQYILLNPLSVIRYNVNNFSGDADIVFAYDPKIFTFAPRAFNLLYGYTKGKLDKAKTDLVEEAFRLRVIGSGMTINDIADISKEGIIRMLSSETDLKPNMVDKYWRSVKDMTTFRENMLRMAAFLYFNERTARGDIVYAASQKDIIDQVKDPMERAARLASNLLGDYGDLTKFGQYMREHVFPFWSWQEINTPRYFRMLKNVQYETKDGKQRTGWQAKARATVSNPAAFAVRAATLFAMIQLVNFLWHRREFEELRGALRRRAELILYKLPNGKIVTIRFQGALSDMLSWVGAEDLPYDVQDVISGKKTIGDKIKEGGEVFVNKIVQGSYPLLKTAGETISGKSWYPDVFEPKPIRDRIEHLSRLFNLDMPYRRIAGKPVGPFWQDVLGIIGKTQDPGEMSYFETRRIINEKLDEMGKARPAVEPTSRSNALYYYKQAVRLGDLKAAQKYFYQYMELGGTPEGMVKSVALAEPLAGISMLDKVNVLNKMDKSEREVLGRANQWYLKVYKGGSKIKERQ